MATCWSGRVPFGVKPPEGACVAVTVDNSIYCSRHLAEALERVQMVRSDRPKRWCGSVSNTRRRMYS